MNCHALPTVPVYKKNKIDSLLCIFETTITFHPITAFMKTYTNFKKIILVRVFWLKYIFRILYKIPILDLMLLPKNSVPFVGLYYSKPFSMN